MSQEYPKTRLPDHEEMRLRLLRVSDDPLRIKHLYPVILRWAGQGMTGPEIAFALGLAVSGSLVNPFGPSSMKQAVRAGLNRYIKALVDDRTVRRQALRCVAYQRLLQTAPPN